MKLLGTLENLLLMANPKMWFLVGGARPQALEGVCTQSVLGGWGGSVLFRQFYEEEALTASSVGCTCLSCCAPQPRCDS